MGGHYSKDHQHQQKDDWVWVELQRPEEVNYKCDFGLQLRTHIRNGNKHAIRQVYNMNRAASPLVPLLIEDRSLGANQINSYSEKVRTIYVRPVTYAVACGQLHLVPLLCELRQRVEHNQQEEDEVYSARRLFSCMKTGVIKVKDKAVQLRSSPHKSNKSLRQHYRNRCQAYK